VSVRNRERRTFGQKGAATTSRAQRHRVDHDRDQTGGDQAGGDQAGGDQAGGDQAGGVPRRVSAEQLVEMMLANAVHAQDREDYYEVANCVRLLAVELGEPGTTPVVDQVLLRWLHHDVGEAWRRGWQPADLVRFAARRLNTEHVRLVVDTIAAQMRAYPSNTVALQWRDQLRSLEAAVWWEHDQVFLQQWGRRVGLDRQGVTTCVVEVLHLLQTLPRIPILCPLPGTARAAQTTARAQTTVQPRMLDKVRALLAKAESTEFPEEAEALTAKAQELMARHSIDEALLAAARTVRDEPAGIRIGVDAPYESPKVMLLQEVATANRCRVVWSRQLGFATVVGFDGDLRAVELLYMSLLVQATSAVVHAGSRRTLTGQSRTRLFRQSFLSGFAARIGQRLRGVTADATRAAGSDALLPVLAARDEAVQEKVNEQFPELTHRRSAATTDYEGWASGTAAADRAVIHAGAGSLDAG
jgi:uncharacterized protein DUF2786